MKWLVLVLCLARYAESGAIRCTPGVEDLSCKTDDVEKEHTMEVLEDSGKETVVLEAECLAGSEWDSNCHSCRCSNAGVAICRRQEHCVLEVDASPLKCKPNTTFVRDCNTCVCLENGLGLCTLETCRRSNIPKKSDLVSGKECASGTSWKSQCNDCICSPEGMASCTEKACPMQESEPIKRCAPDSMWNNECNSCWCNTDGRAMCTRIGCSHEVPSNSDQKIQNFGHPKIADEAVKEASFEYEEEIRFPEFITQLDSKEINTDHNVEESDHSFKDIDQEFVKADRNLEIYEIDEHNNILEEKDVAHTVLKRSVCKPNQVFQSECNTCNCAPDGQSYTCSHNECMEGEKNKEVEVFMENEGDDHVEKHSVCKPRDTFYIGCNTCHCNLYGTDYSCTNKPCPLPEDVEVFHELKDMKPIIPYVNEDSANRNETQKAKEDIKL